MRKIVIIEDDDQVVTSIKLRYPHEDVNWFYVTKNVSESLENAPSKIITNQQELNRIFEQYFNDNDECILFVDIKLEGVISNSEEFIENDEFIRSISEIKKCKKYLIVFISTYNVSTHIIRKLKEFEVNNVLSDDNFKLGDYDRAIEKVNEKWDDIGSDLKVYFNSISRLDSLIVHDFKEDEKKEHLTKLANLLDYRSIDELYSSIELPNEDVDKLFYIFLKGLVECKKNGITLMGIFFIAWRVIEKNKFSDVKNEFLNTLVTINKLENSEYFIRDSFLFAKNSKSIKNIENAINLERFFTLIFVNKEDEKICNLLSVEVSNNSLAFYIEIDFKNFITKVRKHLQALIDPTSEEHDRNETSRAFVEIFKNIIYSDQMDRMNGVVLQENPANSNSLILKFIV